MTILRYQEPHIGIKKTLPIQCNPTIYPMRPPIYQRKPQCESVEYGSHWVCESWVYIGHVDFMLFVSISFALCSQCERVFWWNMGLSMDGIIWQLVPSFKGTVPPNPLCLVLTLLGVWNVPDYDHVLSFNISLQKGNNH